MSLSTKEFNIFGVSYKTKQFSAVRALEIMDMDDIDPTVLLENTWVVKDNNEYPLSDRSNVEFFVCDEAGALSPRIALKSLLIVVHEFNFDFVEGWKGVKIPLKFRDGGTSLESKNVDPIISQLMQDGAASLKELETYYSLKDAFKMFDVITVKVVNECLANEAAMKRR